MGHLRLLWTAAPPQLPGDGGDGVVDGGGLLQLPVAGQVPLADVGSHGYDGFVFDENDQRVDFKGYRADCINDMALEFFDQYDGKKPFFMTISRFSSSPSLARCHLPM